MTRAESTLRELVSWQPHSEQDLYYYLKEFFVNVLGYPRDCVVLGETGRKGIPDISLCPADIPSKKKIYWIPAEVKRIPGYFRDAKIREERWRNQLSRYVSADSVYALLIDPITIAIYSPNGQESKVVKLDRATVETLQNASTPDSLAVLSYANSVSDQSLSLFKEGLAPYQYIDVTMEEGRERFYEALRLSAGELIDHSTQRLREILSDYAVYEREQSEIDAKTFGKDKSYLAAKNQLENRHKESINFVTSLLPEFEQQIGRALPEGKEEASRFLIDVYATEGASLVLARILFVRFFEDHGMVKRKISNGGIKAFHEYYSHVKDDYKVLLKNAYEDLERIYRRLFVPSILDFAHEGDGELSVMLLRIFYRLNAFDFTKITGDILGNLYERFLDDKKRKKVGEYYTPMPVAKYVLERIGFFEDPGPLLDPACGSGTFLIAAMTGMIERLQQRGVTLDVAIKQAVDSIYGLDINFFAAFIAQMQLIWHLFPYLKDAGIKQIPELKIHGGVNSLLFEAQQTLTESLLRDEADDVSKIRDGRYKYVVGNPPYIRNERLKDKGAWREFYREVDFHNSDVSFFFVARSLEGGKAQRVGPEMPSWLESEGRVGFVLPMGICDSAAASRLREHILNWKILEITDLEEVAIQIFPSPQASGRATTAPVLLFVEKTPAKRAEPVNIVTVSEGDYLKHGLSKASLKKSRIPQELFRVNAVNPNGQFLTKVSDDDLPILRKVMISRLEEYASQPTPCYGIKVGSGNTLSDKPGLGLLPIAKGLNVNTFYLDPEVHNWVDLERVEAKSIWGRTDFDSKIAYVLSGITLAPQCADFSLRKFAFNDSARIFIPRAEYAGFPWDVLINSSVIRFVHLLCLRTGLVGVGTLVGNGRRASWCVLYPRVISSFPVPALLVESHADFDDLAIKLRDFSSRIFQRWASIEQSVRESKKKHLLSFDLDFHQWQRDLYEGVELKIEPSGRKESILKSYEGNQELLVQISGPYELLNVVKYLVDRQPSMPTAKEFQLLQIPENYAIISKAIDAANDPDSSDIQTFNKLHTEANRMVSKAFGLTDVELEYVNSRLSSPPFDVLEPRWPWKGAASRTIKGYSTDRFE